MWLRLQRKKSRALMATVRETKEKKRQNSSTRAYYAGKEQGLTKKNNMGFLQVQEIFGTNLFFWTVFRRDKSHAVPRTEEDNNCERVQGGKSQRLVQGHTQKHSAAQLSNTFFFFIQVSPFPGASKGLSNNVRRVAAALATGYLSLVLFGRQFNP